MLLLLITQELTCLLLVFPSDREDFPGYMDKSVHTQAHSHARTYTDRPTFSVILTRLALLTLHPPD